MSQTLRDPREVIREELLMHDPIRAAVAERPCHHRRDRRADRPPRP